MLSRASPLDQSAEPIAPARQAVVDRCLSTTSILHQETQLAHNTIRSGYGHLVNRLNLFPQGAPDTKLLRSILGLLMSEDEADLLALLPIRQFRAEAAAEVWHVSL